MSNLHWGGMMKRIEMLALTMVFGLMALGLGFTQQPAVITAEKIVDNIYIVKGGVANTGFVVGEKEVAAIDAQMTAESARQMIAEIAKVTSKPLSKLILTHSDGDHVNGLDGFPKGIEIIANARAKSEMAEAFNAPNAQHLQTYLPTRTFTDKMDLDLAPEKMQLIHFGQAHTSGDAVVYFPTRKLAFVGDLVFIGRDPLIHQQKGGTCSGLIKTLKALLELNADKYIPGHGGIVTRSDIEGLMKSLQEKLDRVKSLVQEGKSLEEVKTAFGIPNTPAKPGGFRFPSIVEVIYQEVSGK
jgi:glyoxylase-like metal-dependent hydrolase (beta-lactamase superfamily II)